MSATLHTDNGAGHASAQRNAIPVNSRKLLELADCHEWGLSCRRILCGKPLLWPVEPTPEWPATVDYATLRQYTLSGAQLLDVAEARAGMDPLREGGRLALALAWVFFLPVLPADHPARPETMALFNALQAYIDGNAPAETYLRAAFVFRSQYGSAWSARENPEYDDLFDAMPSGGLENVIALEGWRYASQWEMFGRHLVRALPAHRVLEALRESIESTLFVDGDDDHDKEAEEAAHGMIDAELGAYREQVLEDYHDRLVALIDRVVGYAREA